MSYVKNTMLPFKEFKVTRKDVDHWFDILNDEVFDFVVPQPDYIKIMEQCGTWGFIKETPIDEYDTKIGLYLKPKYPSLGSFVEIVAHEMIHIWQIKVKNDTGNHNKLFYSWRKQFKKHNLNLKRCY